MSRFEAWTFHVSVLLVSVTGLIYAWMLYLLEPVDEFSVIHHRWQPGVQHAHIWVAPLLVFALGLIWRNHVLHHYRSGARRRRRSGLSLLLSVAPMVLSGYLIQTSVGDPWRTVWLTVHLTSSSLFVAGYASHQLMPRFRRAAGGGPTRAASETASTPS